MYEKPVSSVLCHTVHRLNIIMHYLEKVMFLVFNGEFVKGLIRLISLPFFCTDTVLIPLRIDKKRVIADGIFLIAT